MSVKEMIGGAFRNFTKVSGAKLKQNRSGIGFAAGVILLGFGTVWACTKTEDAKKAAAEIEREKKEIDLAYQADTEKAGNDEIRLKAVRRERNAAYLKMGAHCVVKFGKIYAGPGAVWCAGLGSITWSHVDQRRENKKILSDLVLLKKGFEEYRARWREKVGEEEESKVFFGTDEREFEIEEIDPKTGNKKLVKKKGKILKEDSGSRFARNFSKRTSYEFDARSYADFFVELKIQELNKRLKSVPFITMNEVYDELGMKSGYGRCKEGLDWGWVYNPMDPDGPNEIVITRLEGWEEYFNEQTNRVEYEPCMRIDFNPQPLRDRI